jgi:hypothetical protein
MTDHFVLALKAEIAELEDELRNDARHRKLARLRETLAEYEPGGHQAQLALNGGAFSMSISPATLKLRTKGGRVKAEIVTLLRQHGAVHRKGILSHLTATGLMGHEKDPMASLAAYFSGWRDTFEADGRGTWSLKEGLKAAE